MAKEKMNHRRKAKQDRVYEELDTRLKPDEAERRQFLSDFVFNDILKKPDKKKPYKGKKKYPPKGDNGNKPINKEQQNKKPGDRKPGNRPNNKPNKPNNKPKPQQSKPNNKPKGKQ